MAPPRRPPRPTSPPARPTRLASLFLVVGCLTVLAVTFWLGLAAGRRWPDGLPGFRGVKTAVSAAPKAPATATHNERDRRPEARGFDKDRGKSPAEAPVLTFYHELTAPLPERPPLTRTSTKPEVPKAEAPKAELKVAEVPRPAAVKPVTPAPVSPAVYREKISPAAAPSSAEPRFTVQVGVFKAKSQAEALRARVAGSGHDVSVTEVDAGGAMQYRVRVGSFATREAAREAAGRLAADRQVATYVTTR